MKRMTWKDGWHKIYENLSIYIENGIIERGVARTRNGYVTAYPYISDGHGGYDRAYGVKANKRNFEKLYFF